MLIDRRGKFIKKFCCMSKEPKNVNVFMKNFLPCFLGVHDFPWATSQKSGETTFLSLHRFHFELLGNEKFAIRKN